MFYKRIYTFLFSFLSYVCITNSLIAGTNEAYTEAERENASKIFARYLHCSNYRPQESEERNNYIRLRDDLIWRSEDYKKLVYSFMIYTNFKLTPEISLRNKHQGAFLRLLEDYIIDLHEPKGSPHYIDAGKKVSLNLGMLEGAYLQGKEGICPDKEQMLKFLEK